MKQGLLLAAFCVLFSPALTGAQETRPFGKLEVTGKHRFITYLAFSPNGKTLAASHCWSHGPTFVTFWNASDGKQIRTVDGPAGLMGFNPLVYSPDGKWIAVGGIQEILLLHSDGRPAHQIEVPDKAVLNFGFAPDSASMASCGWGDGMVLWDVVTSKEKTTIKKRAELQIDREMLVDVKFSANGKEITGVGHRLVNGNNADWKVQVWDAVTRKIIREFAGEKNGRFREATLTNDGRILGILKEESLELWDTMEGKQIRSIPSRGKDWRMHFNLTPDGKSAAILNVKKTEAVEESHLTQLDLRTGKSLSSQSFTTRNNEKFVGPFFILAPTSDSAAFLVDESEIALWRAKLLLGGPSE